MRGDRGRTTPSHQAVQVASAVLVVGAATLFLSKPESAQPSVRVGPPEHPAFGEEGSTAAPAAIRKPVRVRDDLATSAHPLLDSPIVAESHVDTDADVEWESMRRGFNPPIPRILLGNSARLLQATMLFRHKKLNPLDKYIPQPRRNQFTEWFEAYRERVVGAHKMLRRVAVQVTDRRIAAGEQHPLEYKTDAASVEYVEKAMRRPGTVITKTHVYEGGDRIDVVYCVAGVTYGIVFADLPEVKAMVDRADSLTKEFAARTVGWFVAQSCLPQHEAVAVLSEIFS